MDEKTNFIKIRVFLLNSPLITSNGILQERNRKEEEYYNPEEQIREKIILSINDKIGLHNWAIKFIEEPEPPRKFAALLYADNENDALIIKNILFDKLGNDLKNCYYKGTVNDYIGNLS